MRKNLFKKLVAMAACAAMSVVMMTGCNSSSAGSDSTTAGSTTGSTTTEAQTTTEAASKTDSNKSLSGTISLAGSTSMQKLADALAETFMEANSGVTVTVEYSGSSAGIESLLGGS